MSYIGDFFSIFYDPDRVLEKLKVESKKAVTTLLKISIGAALTIITMFLTFIGVIILEIYYLIMGRISFSIRIIIDPIRAAVLIPVVFWIFDTILLVISLSLVKVKIDVLNVLNIRAFSLAPIPLKMLYIYYVYAEVSLKYMIRIPTSIISIILTAWSVILLIRGLHKLFDIPWSKAIISGVFPFIVKALIAIAIY